MVCEDPSGYLLEDKGVLFLSGRASFFPRFLGR